mmetsp:Transcript_4497/g.9676  ORF Transcript_4497/g.9676 Transcript_4497/m.9676 type:complete len:215 (-) Transcript_4497:142-786(-)
MIGRPVPASCLIALPASCSGPTTTTRHAAAPALRNTSPSGSSATAGSCISRCSCCSCQPSCCTAPATAAASGLGAAAGAGPPPAEVLPPVLMAYVSTHRMVRAAGDHPASTADACPEPAPAAAEAVVPVEGSAAAAAAPKATSCARLQELSSCSFQAAACKEGVMSCTLGWTEPAPEEAAGAAAAGVLAPGAAPIAAGRSRATTGSSSSCCIRV